MRFFLVNGFSFTDQISLNQVDHFCTVPTKTFRLVGEIELKSEFLELKRLFRFDCRTLGGGPYFNYLSENCRIYANFRQKLCRKKMFLGSLDMSPDFQIYKFIFYLTASLPFFDIFHMILKFIKIMFILLPPYLLLTYVA